MNQTPLHYHLRGSILYGLQNTLVSIRGDALQVHPERQQVANILPYLGVVLPVREADQLRVAVHIILVAYQAEPLEVRAVNPQVHPLALYDFNGWGLR